MKTQNLKHKDLKDKDLKEQTPETKIGGDMPKPELEEIPPGQ